MEPVVLERVGVPGEVLTVPIGGRNKPYQVTSEGGVVATIEPGPEKRTELVRVVGAVWLLRRAKNRALSIEDPESGDVVAQTDKRRSDAVLGEWAVRVERSKLTGTPRRWVGADGAPLLEVSVQGVFKRSVQLTVGPNGLPGRSVVALVVLTRHLVLDADDDVSGVIV